MNQAPAIEIRNVTAVYNRGTANEVVALRDVSLSLSKGEIAVVTGGNGSGKSTLLRVIAGTVPIICGQVMIDGKDVTNWPAYQRARMIASVPQDPMLGTCPSLSVFDNMQISLRRQWWDLMPQALRLNQGQAELLHETSLRLDAKVATPANMLSGGQRQLITLCLALGSGRPILFLDEFTASLAQDVAHSAMSLLQREVRDRGLTVLLVTHDFERVANLCHRHVVIANGSVLVTTDS